MECSHFLSCSVCQKLRSEEIDKFRYDLAESEEKIEVMKYECESFLQEVKKAAKEVDTKNRILERLAQSLKVTCAQNQRLKKDTIVAERHARECVVKQISLQNQIANYQQMLSKKRDPQKQSQQPPEDQFDIFMLNQMLDYLLNRLSGYSLQNQLPTVRPHSYAGSSKLPVTPEITRNMTFVERAGSLNVAIGETLEHLEELLQFYCQQR